MKTLKLNILLATVFIAIVGFFAMTTASQDEFESNLIFSHQLHVEESGMECETCHSAVTESNTLKSDLVVKEETCLNCHERDDNCDMCHTNPKNPKFNKPKSEYTLTFSHEAHIDRNLECQSCHSGITQSENLNLTHSPEMSNCMVCHDLTDNMTDCYLCHDHKQELKPMDHDAMWAANHGKFKESGMSNCETCHTENYCITCHKGENLFAESHPPEFILTHGMSYLAKESNCASCHDDQQFCIECHTVINYVKPPSHSIPSWNPGWIGSLHATEGKYNREYCGVCHSEADPTCIQCHNSWGGK